jgi:hypothetical protein
MRFLGRKWQKKKRVTAKAIKSVALLLWERSGPSAVRMDGGRDVQLGPREHPHLDHGYAVTSHSSQGQTAERDSRRRLARRGRRAGIQTTALGFEGKELLVGAFAPSIVQ